MSFRQSIETIVYFDNFHNIDLFFQGYYFFTARIYYEDSQLNLRVISSPTQCQIPNDPSFNPPQIGPKKSPEMGHLLDQSQLPLMPVFSEDDSPTSTQHNSFADTQPIKIKEQATPVRSERQNLPNTPQKLFSNNLKSYNQVKREDSPFNSRACVVPVLDESKFLRQHNLRGGECDRSGGNYYRSKVFYIRYSDETVRINEVIAFKTEVETLFTHERGDESIRPQQSQKQPPKFFLEIDLYFKEATPQEIANQLNITMRIDDENLRRFTRVAVKKYTLNKLQKGAFMHYYPVQFTGGYFSCLQLFVHSATTEFRYREASLFAQVYNAHFLEQKRNQKQTPLMLRIPVRNEVDLIIEAISTNKTVLVGYIHRKNLKGGLTELFFSTVSKNRFVTRKEVRQLQRLFVAKLVEMQETLLAILQSYLVEMRPGTKGQIQVGEFELEETEDLLAILVDGKDRRDAFTHRDNESRVGIQGLSMIGKHIVNRTLAGDYLSGSDTSSESLRVQSPSISPKQIQQSVIAHRDRTKPAPVQPPSRILNITKMQINMTLLQQKQRDKSTPPRNSLSRSPIAQKTRPIALIQKNNNQGSTTTLMSYSNEANNQHAFKTSQIQPGNNPSQLKIDYSPVFDKRKEVNRTAQASPYNKQLMVKNAHAAHKNAINALMKSPQTKSHVQLDDKRQSRDQKSPARHVKLKISKNNQPARQSQAKAKSPQTVLLIGQRQPDTAKEKHMQLSQILAHSKQDLKVINTCILPVKQRNIQKPQNPITKAAVPSIKPSIQKVISDDLSLTSEDSLPNNNYFRRDKPPSQILHFQEAKNLSSIELSNQYIQHGHEELQTIEISESFPHSNVIKTKQSLNRSNLSLPHDIDYKTINSLNGQFNKARGNEEESKNFIVHQRGHDHYKSTIDQRRRKLNYRDNKDEDIDEESNCTDENLNEQHRLNFQEMQSRPTAIKATPGIDIVRKKREDVSPQLKSNHWEENFDRQTPAIFSKHSVISQRSDFQISSFLDSSIISNLSKAEVVKQRPNFKRNLDIERLQIATDSFFQETDDTFVKQELTKKSNKQISSIQLHGVSKKNHQAGPIMQLHVKANSPQLNQFDAFKTCLLLEKQLVKCSSQVQQIWLKLTRAVFLDPTACQKVLQKQYIVQARKFYSQTIVEVYNNIRSANDEDLNGLEIDNENVIVRQSIKDSGLSMMQHKHYLQHMKNEQQKREVHPFEEAKSQHLKQLVKIKHHPQGAMQDRFSFGIQHTEYSKFQHPPETERSKFPAQPKSQLFKDIGERMRSISIPKPRENIALGARPLSPKQIEKSNAIAKDRRRDCSQVRDLEDTELTVYSSQSDEPVKIDFSQRMRSRSQLPIQNLQRKLITTMQTTNDARELEKVTMPIQELEDKESQQTKHYEPIIMEEVYFNEQEIETLRTKKSSIHTEVQLSNPDLTPRNKSPHLSHIELSSIAKEDFIAISTQKPATGVVVTKVQQINPQQLQGAATPYESKRFGPLMKQNLRGNQQYVTETELDRYSDTVSNFNVTSTVSQADKLRREKFSQINLLENQSLNLHLIVFVHGFQAAAADMRCFRNHLQTVLPNAIFLVSSANERDTDSKIEVLGQRLANEVQEFIFQNLCGARRPSNSKKMFLEKLTFIGHSLGGIIVREALKHLGSFRAKMHAYISLGSPHLGYMYNSSSLVDAGMWLIKKWKQSDSLKQLSMTDTSNKEDSFIFKLSKDDSLKHFKYVMLVSSFQDNYAPHDSARIQMCKKAAEADASRGRVYSQMVENILSSLQCKKLFRLDVNFKIENTNFASFIGRTAHILLIECEPFILSLIYKYTEVFCE